MTWIVGLLGATLVVLGTGSGDFVHKPASPETSVPRVVDVTSCDESRAPSAPSSIDVATTAELGDEACEVEPSEEEGSGMLPTCVAHDRSLDDTGCACKPAVDSDGNNDGSSGFAARAPPARVRPRR